MAATINYRWLLSDYVFILGMIAVFIVNFAGGDAVNYFSDFRSTKGIK